MSEKVIIKKDVADAIERYLNAFGKQALVSGFLEVDGDEVSWSGEYAALYEIDFDTLLSAIVNGYTVERTPEEKLRERYEHLRKTGRKDEYADGKADGFLETLNTLGLSIEGVNA